MSSSQKVLDNLKRSLVARNLYIGPATFTNGFISVLHEACYCDHVSVVQYILDRYRGQFDINQLVVYHPYPCFTQNESPLWQRKQTLVHAAVENSFFREKRSPKLLKLLISHGASVNIPDCCSVTPLLKAVSTKYSCKETVRLLLNARADIHYRDVKGQTVLMYAVSGQADEDIISLLLKAGADPTLTDERGYTVLHHSVYYGRCDYLRLLLSLKIPPTLCPLPSKPHAVFLADRAEFLKDETDFLTINNHEHYLILTAVFAEHSHFPWDLKVDSFLVNASCNFYLYRNKRISACCVDIKQALTIRAQLKLPPPSLSQPIEAYGGLTEITSIEEFEENYSDLTNINTQVNLAYQCLLMRERCLGYGDSTVIKFLFAIGKWMISIKYYAKGLLLWLRATGMLIARLQEGVQSVQSELKCLIENGYCECSEIEIVLRQQPDSYRDLFIPILRNLIECQRLSINFYTYKLHHVHSLYDGDFTNNFVVLVEILQILFENPVQGVDVSMLCREIIEKCPTFPAVFPLYSNLLDRAMSRHCLLYLPFLSLLLESGGYMLVNDVGLDSLRPLEKANSKEVTSLLLAHGAHPDAVSRSTSPQVNPFLDKYVSDSFPLTCLSAKYIVMESIPYQLMDLPRHIKYFIALHDPDPDHAKN